MLALLFGNSYSPGFIVNCIPPKTQNKLRTCVFTRTFYGSHRLIQTFLGATAIESVLFTMQIDLEKSSY